MRTLATYRTRELLPFLIDRFDKDDSYLAQVEALRAIGSTRDHDLSQFLRKAATLDSPRNALKEAAEEALAQIKLKFIRPVTYLLLKFENAELHTLWGTHPMCPLQELSARLVLPTGQATSRAHFRCFLFNRAAPSGSTVIFMSSWRSHFQTPKGSDFDL